MEALANWMWQGGAVALAATIILRASNRMSATTRYVLWWIALATVLALPGLPWLTAFITSHSGGVPLAFAGTVATAPVAALSGATPGVVLPVPPAWLMPLLVALWSTWLIVSVARTAAAYVNLRRVRRAARRFPARREQRLQTWLSMRTRGRRVELAISDHVRAAAVLGLASPTIAVAPHALAALDDAELDQIVVHEWAHVQRRDDVARLLQRIVVAIAGFHPAVWWIDRQLNLERETACDDWALNAGSGKSLAVCLTRLASLPGGESNGALMPSALLTSELSTRVTRLLDIRRNTSTTPTIGVPMIGTTVLCAIALTVAGVDLVVTAPLASEREAAESAERFRLKAEGPIPGRHRASRTSRRAPSSKDGRSVSLDRLQLMSHSRARRWNISRHVSPQPQRPMCLASNRRQPQSVKLHSNRPRSPEPSRTCPRHCLRPIRSSSRGRLPFWSRRPPGAPRRAQG